MKYVSWIVLSAFLCSGMGWCELDCTNIKCSPHDINPDCMSPIVIDLAGDHFHFGGPESAVYFDLFGDGSLTHMQWVLPGEDDAFLFVDLNGNGVADDGTELFGSGSVMIATGARAVNGFVALAQYDAPELGGDDDGLISGSDFVWDLLYFWRDEDADGVCRPDEVRALAETDFLHLEIIPRERNRKDPQGNWLRFVADALAAGPKRNGKVEMVDVFFVTFEPENGIFGK